MAGGYGSGATPPAAPPPATESVNFRNDELSRIVSLVRYR
jgi:hypothetical protein